MSWSVTQFFLIEGCFAPLLGHLGLDLVQRPCLGLVAGRAYLNLSLLGNLLKMMPPLLTPDLEEVLGGQQRRAGIIQPRDLPGTGPRAGFRLGIRLLGLAVRGLFYLRRRSMDRFHEDLRRRMDDLDQTDLAALSDAALVEFVPGIARRILPEIGSTAFTARTLACFLPRLGCVLLVGPLCRLWLSPEDGAVSTQLLRGAGLMASAESGLDLWRLATWVRAHPALAQRLLETPSFAALETCWRTIPNGSEFKERWQSFLARHGHHARGELDIYSVRWREQPDYVLDLLRQYLRAGPDTDPVRRHTDALRERQALLNRYEQRLRNPLQRWTLRFCIEQGRRGVAFRENIKSEAVRGFGMVRRALFEVGARLTQRGVLRARDEVFFLHLEELRPLLLGPGLADLQAILTARQAEHARLRRLNPPPVVAGPFDPDHPVHLLPDAEATSQPQPAHTVDGPARLTLNGVAVSPGVVTGPARVILHADAQTRVLPGEILVACFTDPGWTPYFLTAAGLVTDLGGQLSHGSIVAREYGLPAVVNTAHATQVIQTGQLLRVDGNRGVVEVL